MSEAIKFLESLRDRWTTQGAPQTNIDPIDAAIVEIGELQKVEKTARQFMLEVSHAMQSGPGWYTKGETGLRMQIHMWIERMRNALDSVTTKDSHDK